MWAKTTFFLLVSLCLFSFASEKSDSFDENAALELYKVARAQEKTQPDLACHHYQKLSGESDFILADLALVRQALVCERPADSIRFSNEDFKAYLKPLALEARIRILERSQEVLAATEARIRKARQNKMQSAVLAELKSLESWIQKTPADPKNTQLALDLTQEAREQRAPRFLKNPEPADYLKVATDLISSRDFKKGRDYAKKVITTAQFSIEEKTAAHKLIRSAYKIEQKTKEFLAAYKKEFNFVMGQKNNDSKKIETGLSYSRALWTDGKTKEAERILIRIEQLREKGHKINEAYFIRGKMAEEKKNYTLAHREYSKAEADLGTGIGKKIQFAKAWTAIKSGQQQQALLALSLLLALPENENFEVMRALYWLSRVQKNLNQEPQWKDTLLVLMTLDPLGYYGAIAAHDLNEPLQPLAVPSQGFEFPKSDFENLRLYQALYSVSELDLLKSLAELDLAQLPIDAQIDQAYPSLIALAKSKQYLPLFSQISLYPPQKRLETLKMDPRFLFPLDFQDLIRTEAQKQNVPPELVLAIIRQESAFDPEARSSADALGLMQVLPNVHEQYQKKIQIPISHHEDYFLPEKNIPYGVALLSSLIQKHEGRIERIAAAYNASESALKTWIKDRWNGDLVEFIEEIPYEETRGYVKLIIRNCVFYHRMSQAPSSPTTGFPEQCFKISK